ncbi:MAG: DNA adenine methylase [Bacteroidota bacterium]
MHVPNPFPYQGSKRNIANQILRYFPDKTKKLIEPFAGSAAISLASSFFSKSDSFLINDLNEPLINLWDKIINYPNEIISEYHDIWFNQLGREEEYYYEIREKFNNTHQPEHLLFLFAKCVKASVRYNEKGEFNQSPDKRRLGRNPKLSMTIF